MKQQVLFNIDSIEKLKRNIMLITVTLFLWLLCGISYCVKADNDISVDEQVLIDDDNLKITVTGYGDTSGKSIYFLIENKTDVDLTFYAKKTSVNGIMLDGSLYKAVAAHSSEKTGLEFLDFQLKEVNIDQIGEIETAFYASDGKDDGISFETDVVSIKTSVYGTFAQTYDDAGDVLANEAGIKIIKKELSTSGQLTNQNYYVDNTTNKEIQIVATQIEVNGILLDNTLTFDLIEPGKKAIQDIGLFKSDLDKVGIQSVKSISAYLTVSDANTGEVLINKIFDFGGDSSGIITALPLSEGIVYSDGYVEVKASNMQVDNLNGIAIDLNIANTSDVDYQYCCGEIRVNGKTVSGKTTNNFTSDFLVDITAGDSYDTVLQIDREVFRKQAITEINSLEIDMKFFISTSIVDITVTMPFNENSSVSTDVVAKISNNIDDYVANTYFIHGTDMLYVLYELKNPNEVNVSIDGNLSFKDADGNVIDTDTDSLDYIKSECYNFLIFQSTATDTQTVTLSLTPKKSSQKTANITYSVDEVSNSEIKVTVTNNSNQKANIRLLVIFMKDGQVYGFNRKAKFEVEANGSSVQDITMPYDKYYVYLTGCLE